jgi:hypothetical protein
MTGRVLGGGCVSGVLLNQVGSLDLLDLEVMNGFYGRDFLPYPFMFTQPSRFATQDEASAYTITVPDRMNYGDLSVFAECVLAYQSADIRVECHVQHIPAVTPSVRMVAYRNGHLGFFAAQRDDADVVDVYTVSPFDLGAAISDALSLTQPGQHPRIVVPEYAAQTESGPEPEGFVIRHEVHSPAELTVPASNVTAYATVQSHWGPTRKWGVDRGKPFLLWIRVNDDGEYIYVPDNAYATPMAKSVLQGRIDRLIADDIAVLRELRRD